MKAVTIAGGLLCLIAATPLWAQNDPSRAASSSDELFKRLDRNGDGKLTRDEIPRLFDQLDANKDGVVTPEEARAYRPGAPVSPAPRPSKSAPSADTLKRTLDIRYANTPGVDAKSQSLDVYAPKDAKDAPVMIYVHGGYWRVGDKAAVDAGPDFFCGAGYLFVSINYRLTPAGKHPANIQDVAKAVAWVHDHVAEHGGDPAQMFLMGHSAGGHLVALLGTDATRLGEAGKPLSVLRGVIPLDAAAYDLREVTANDRSPDSPFRGAFGDDPAAWADASPIVHIGNGRTVPPFQIVVADGPALAKKRQGVDGFAAALRKAGAHTEIVDTSGFRDHQTLIREFGKPDDSVSKVVLHFCEAVRGGKGLAGPGGERVLQSESKSAAEAAIELATRRANAVFKALDKNRDGKITRDELPEQYRRLFEQLDKNEDGALTPDEAGSLVQQRAQAPETPSASQPGIAPAAATSAPMKTTLDIHYANTPGVDAKSQSLDVYAPNNAKNAPVIIFIHGGGWRRGDKSNPGVGSQPAAHFCAEGFVFVSINYRLTPAGKHPANIQDVAKAVAWVHDHIAEQGGDPAQISIMGHSAGAHLTALVSTDESRLQAEGKSLSILKRAILLDTAAYDIPRYLTEFQEAGAGGSMRQLYTNAFGDTADAWRDASPQAHVAPGKHIPPMLLFFTSSRMAANTLAPALADALTKAGAPSRAVDTVTLSHNEIGTKAADKNHPLGQLVLRFFRGEDVTKFPDKLGTATPAPSTPVPHPVSKPAASVKESSSANTSPFLFTFTRDYFPGTKDRNGQLTTGTECNYIVAHDGKLWATISCWNLDQNGPNPGPHVLVKKSAAAPWEVDQVFGPEYLRAECLNEVVFTTDRTGRKLAAPVKLLLAGTTRIRPPLDAGAWSRDDATGKWTRMVFSSDIVRADGQRNTGLRAIAGHYDAVTGVHYVFAAASAGAIFCGAYDPAVPGKIVWEKTPELGGTRKRIHALAEANGVLYAAVGVDSTVTGPEGGGLHRRVDGPQPRWEFEYRWKAESDRRNKSMPAFRGLSAIPASDGQGEELIGAPETLGVVEVISPRNNHAARQELDIGAYFARAWGVEGAVGGGLFAYNEFTPFTHPDTGERVWLVGGGLRPPQGGEFARSAWYLVRHADARYTHGRIWDAAHPPSEKVLGGLRSCRTICLSPFAEDRGRVLYFGGFDAFAGPFRDTAWIYKATLPTTNKEEP